MMYLVLTALLALNVSSEILNAFKIVDESIIETNKNFEKKINETYTAFSLAAMDDPGKNQKWFDKAQYVKELTDHLVDSLIEVRSELIWITEGKNDKYFINGQIDREALKNITTSDLFALDKNDGPVRYFMGKNEHDRNNGVAVKLKKMFDRYRQQVVSVLETEEQQASLLQKIGLNTEGPDKNGKFKSKSKGKLVDWEDYYFGETILAADIVILNNFIQEARNAEYDIISSLRSEVGATDFKFNSIVAKIIPDSKSVIVGDYYRAYASVVAFDTTDAPEVLYQLGAKEWDPSMESSAKRSEIKDGIPYLEIQSGMGEQYLAGVIKVRQPDGSLKDYTFSDVFYGQAKGAGSIVNDELKVLYMGYNNAIAVDIPGSRKESITCSVTGGSAAPPTRDNSFSGRAVFRVNPTGLGDITLTASGSDGGSATSVFKVRELPAPLVTLGGETKLRTLSKSAILSAGRLEASLGKDFLLSGDQFKYTIIEFTMQYPRTGGGISQQTIQGGSFNDQVKKYINDMPSNTMLSFFDIKVKGPDGRIKESQNTLSFTVQ
ncbi:MAG: hypothetical protein FWG84_04505 [Bacteroidales bacterium]|nr:hypothetical protein [Bacteroidales bacterium]